MLKISNQKRAKYLLDARQRSGPTLLHFLRSNQLRYLGIGGYCAVFCGYMAFTNQWFMFWVLLALVLGAIVSDLSWLRAAKKSWAFTERVMNWDEVKRIADEKPKA